MVDAADTAQIRRRLLVERRVYIDRDSLADEAYRNGCASTSDHPVIRILSEANDTVQ